MHEDVFIAPGYLCRHQRWVFL